MASIKIKRAAKRAATVAAPFVLAAAVRAAAGGKLDLKGLALDVADEAVRVAKAKRVAAGGAK